MDSDMPTREALALHQDSLIIDAHADSIQCALGGRRLGERSDQGQFDLPRALEGGITAELTAIYLRDPRAGAIRQAIQFVDALNQEVEAFPNMALQATRADDILRAKQEGKVALLLTMEGAEGLEGDLRALRVFHRLGLRSLGLTWNRRNEAADGVDEIRTGGGLTQFGVSLVEECNRLGILVDMAHLSPTGVSDVLGVSEAPVIVTHANCATLCPHPRNLTDAQLEAIASKGGVVGVTAVPRFLGEEESRCPLRLLLDHIDHMLSVVGEDSIGIGTDFDGVGENRVVDLEDASKMPNLTAGLLRRGHSPERIRKILGGNFLRVFRQVVG